MLEVLMGDSNFNEDALQQQQIADLSKKVDALTLLLTGNGDPTKGMVVQVTLLNERLSRALMLETRMSHVEDAMMEIKTKVESARNWQNNISKFLLPILVAVLLAAGAFMFQILVGKIVLIYKP